MDLKAKSIVDEMGHRVRKDLKPDIQPNADPTTVNGDLDLPSTCVYASIVRERSNSLMDIQFTTRVFKEGRTFVAHALEFDVASCGGTKEKAVSNLKEAVRLFLEEAEKMHTLDQILAESGYTKRKTKIETPKFISVQQDSLAMPLIHARA